MDFFYRKDAEVQKIVTDGSLFNSAPPRLCGLFVRYKGERHRRQNANKGGEMVPSDFFAKIKNGKAAKHDQRDDFLNDFQLRGGINRVAPASCRT